MILRNMMRRIPALAAILLVGSTLVAASDDHITVMNLEQVVKSNPLPTNWTASIVESIRAGGAEMSVLLMRKNRLHHHSHQDHVLYVARGRGTARLENATGQIEARIIGPGDILGLPRGRKHGFEKSGDEDLVFLLVATPLPPGVEETTYHE